MTRYRSRAARPIAAGLAAAGSIRRDLPAERWLCRHALWGALATRRASRPDTTNRLALSVDLDYQADTDALPRLLDLAARHSVRLSIAAVGALVEADPGPYERAVAAGHEIVNHTMTHPDNPVLNPREQFWDLSSERMAEEVLAAQDVFDHRLGVRPIGFRTPHFKDAHRMLAVLESVPEISYVSSALATRCPLGRQPFLTSRHSPVGQTWGTYLAPPQGQAEGRVMQIPLAACPAHRWTPYCSWHGIRAGAVKGSGAGMHSLPQWARLWGDLLDRALPDGLVVTYFDPHDLMRDEQTVRTFDAMLAEAAARGWRSVRLSDVDAAYRAVPRSDSGQ